MAEVRLYDSTICRLCAEDNGNGELLYESKDDNDEHQLSSLVNRYLPLKIRDDGKLPRTICPGCNIQLEATVQFFELVVDGQRKIREMWKQQTERQRKAEKEKLRAEKENTELLAADIPELNDISNYNSEDQFEQQIIIKNLENDMKSEITVMPDGSMYTAEHEMSLQMEGLNKPKRKRGRPPKSHAEQMNLMKEERIDIGSQYEEDKQEEETEEIDGDGRRRRKRKVPKRFMEAVQGKELERIFKEEGVIDEEDDESENFEYTEENFNVSVPNGQEEIIGHLESEEGKDLGELVIINRGRGRGRPKLRRRKTKFTCQLCGRGFLQRSRYIVHKSFHKSVKYECLDCKKIFTSKDHLSLHQKTIHQVNSLPDESANQQNDSKDSEDPAKADQETENNIPETEDKNEDTDKYVANDKDSPTEEKLNCAKCEKTFDSKHNYETHVKVVHKREKIYTCHICDKSFSYRPNLKAHLVMHEGNKPEKEYPCDICGKVLNHPSSVIYHKEAEHNNGRRFVCNKCGKSFKHKQLLQRHQLVHSDDRPYVCKSCNASFKTKANLINHQSTHTGEKKYFCEICGQQFAHKTSLTLHYRWHTGHKPYSCEVCQKTFSQNGNLQEHMRIHTGEKPYCCDYCGRKFTTSSQFKLHVKRHTGERPWKCEFCAKCFLHKDTWKCHVRRHKGERPFQCSQCNRGFTEQWALKKHLRLHTGEKPYSCELCGKAFADCSNLTKHKKVHKESSVSLADAPEGSSIGEVWQILPSSQVADEHSLTNPMTQVITDETSGDGIPQIIYVSYQDPDDPNQSRTLHFMDSAMIRNKGRKQSAANQSLPTVNVGADLKEEILSGSLNSNQNNNVTQRMNMAFSDSDLHLQITDAEGNPIPLSLQDARHFLAHGQFTSHLNDEQEMRVHSTDTNQELSTSSGIHVQENSGKRGKFEDSKNSKNETPAQSDTGDLVKTLEDENTDETRLVAINQIEETEETEIDNEQTIEFTTQDGQKVRLVTSYHVDPMQLASEYLTIV